MTLQAERYWNPWLDSERNVDDLRIFVRALLGTMRLAGERLDWEAFAELIEILQFVEAECAEEPLRTEFEFGLAHATVEWADVLTVLGSYEQAVQSVRGLLELLEAGNQRRLKAGMVPRPNSSIRSMCIGIEALCVLEEPALFLHTDRGRATELLTLRFWMVTAQMMRYQARNLAPDDPRRALTLHAIARWELEICKLCWRYSRPLASEAVRQFNQRHGEHLFYPPLHFEKSAVARMQSAWYWDFELSKLESAQLLTKDRIRLCDEQRRIAAGHVFGQAPRALFKTMWDVQISRMIEAIDT